MSALSIEQALENIYSSLENDNLDIDLHIDALKTALLPNNFVKVDPERLAQNNRQGRKMMQSYFQKRGVVVQFPK
jgi:hypothetical protein